MIEKIPLVISVSGGRTSAYMVWLLTTSPLAKEYKAKYRYIFVFANTGKEREETLVFLKQIQEYFQIDLVWVEAVVNPEIGKVTKHRVVDFNTACRDGRIFESVIVKYSITNEAFPSCTRELKLRPITSYVKTLLKGQKYITAIGIRIDEARRSKPDPIYFYPLLERRNWINGKGILNFWNNMPFDLQLKSHEGNCDLCWKKSAKKKMHLIRENPSIAEWWIEMEDKYSQGKYYFHRSNESTRSLVERALNPSQLLISFPTDEDENECTCRNSFDESENEKY